MYLFLDLVLGNGKTIHKQGMFFISSSSTHSSHHLALLAHFHNCLHILCPTMPEVSLADFNQGPLFSKMPQIFMHLDYKCHSFLWFGHKQSLEVKPLLLPTIIGYSLSGPLVFLKVHHVW
jgi:hypothetical protein